MCCFFAVEAVNILSATYQRKVADSLTTSYELGIYEVEFDEPLALLESFGHCDFACVPPEEAPPNQCPGCDYSDPDICSGIRVNDTLCPCPISVACNMTFLSSNVSLTNVINPEEYHYYAFFIDASSTCDFFLLELLGIDGDLELAAVAASNFDILGGAAFDAETISFHENPDSILFCPSSFLEYSGTYVVRVGNLDTIQETHYNLLLRNRKLPFATSPEVVENCTAASVDHICLEDDRVLSMPMPEVLGQYLSFKLPVQCPVSVSIFSHRPFILSLTNPFPNFETDGDDPRTLWIELTPKERVVQSFCVTNDTYLYIGIPGIAISPEGSTNHLTISVSTNPGWVYTRSLSDYPPHALVYALGGTSFVTTQNERLMCDCPEFYENGCDSYWQLYSGQEVNPLIPIPPSIRKKNRANLHNTPLSPLDNHKYAVAVVLASRPLERHGFRRITVEQFESGIMHFMGRIVDSQGKPIIMNTTFVPKSLSECNYNLFKEHHKRVTDILNQLVVVERELSVNSLRLELNGIVAYDSYIACKSFVEGLFETAAVQETVETDRCIQNWGEPDLEDDPCCLRPSNWYWRLQFNDVICDPRNVTFNTPQLVDISANTIQNQCFSAPCVQSLAKQYFPLAARQQHPFVGCDSNFITEGDFSLLMLNFSSCTDEHVDTLEIIRCQLHRTHPKVLDRLGPIYNVSISDTSDSEEGIFAEWEYALQYVSCYNGFADQNWGRYDLKDVSDDACVTPKCGNDIKWQLWLPNFVAPPILQFYSSYHHTCPIQQRQLNKNGNATVTSIFGWI